MAEERRERSRWRTLAGLPGWIGGAGLLAFGGWALLYGMTLTGLGAAALPVLWVPLRKRGLRWVLLGLWGVAAGLSWRLPLHEYAGATAERGSRRAELGVVDLVAIWGLNGLMGGAGFALGVPEVSVETWLLAVPGGGERRFSSAFAMRSPAVRAEVRRMARSALRAGPGPLPAGRVSWGGHYDSDSPRVALALDCPLTLSGQATPSAAGDLWLDLEARCHVAYPQRSQLAFGRVDEVVLRVDEGLFWELQQRGWMFPYDVVYTWRVRADDPALDDTEAWLGPVEGLVMRWGLGAR